MGSFSLGFWVPATWLPNHQTPEAAFIRSQAGQTRHLRIHLMSSAPRANISVSSDIAK
jgi:hypothetical protein